MSKLAAHPSRFWIDEFAASGYLTASDLEIMQETIPVDTFLDAGPRRLVGNYSHKGSHSGLFDAATDAFDPQAFINLRTDEDHYLLQMFGSAAEGAVAYERLVRLSEQARSAAIGQAILLNLTDEGSGPIVRGQLLRSAVITGTGNGTGRNLGATIAGQIRVVTYRVLAVTGSGSITLQYHESANDGSPDAYANVAALASGALTAIGVTRVSTAAASEAWGRITVSAFSGFTNVTVLVTAGTQANS